MLTRTVIEVLDAAYQNDFTPLYEGLLTIATDVHANDHTFAAAAVVLRHVWVADEGDLAGTGFQINVWVSPVDNKVEIKVCLRETKTWQTIQGPWELTCDYADEAGGAEFLQRTLIEIRVRLIEEGLAWRKARKELVRLPGLDRPWTDPRDMANWTKINNLAVLHYWSGGGWTFEYTLNPSYLLTARDPCGRSWWAPSDRISVKDTMARVIHPNGGLVVMREFARLFRAR